MSHFSRPSALLACGALLLAAAATGCSEASTDSSADRRQFDVRGEQLTLVSDNSRLDLTAADVDRIEVVHTFDGWHVGGGIEPVMQWEDNTLRLDLDCGGLLKGCDSRYEVKVPRGLKVTATAENETVTAAGFRNGLTLRSDNGDLKVDKVAGPLDLHSANGRITGDAVGSTTVKAVAENDSLQLAFDTAPSAVDASSSNSSVRIKVPQAGYAVRATSGSNDVEVTVKQDSGSKKRITAHSDNKKVSVVNADAE